MPKRFTDTEKWKDPWFCALSEKDRYFWMYLLDNCDHAGIWQVNPMLVNFYFPGYSLDPGVFGDRIQVLNSEKWWLKKFVSFQYGEVLNPENHAHLGVINRLKQVGANMGLVSPKLAPLDKDKDKVKDKVRETAVKVKDVTPVVYTSAKFMIPKAEEVVAYAQSIGFKIDGERFLDYYTVRGWKLGRTLITDWKACVRNWKRNVKENNPNASDGSQGRTSGIAILRAKREAEKLREQSATRPISPGI
jgi:hypothetical protein